MILTACDKSPPAPPGNLWDVIQDFDARCIFANGVRLTCRTGQPLLRFEGTEGWIEVGYPNSLATSDESLLTWRPGAGNATFTLKHSEKRDFLDAVNKSAPPADARRRMRPSGEFALAPCTRGHRTGSPPQVKSLRRTRDGRRHRE